MDNKKITEHILKNFIIEGFFDSNSLKYKLREEEINGKQELIWNCLYETNLCIKNFDKKKSINFLKDDKRYGLSNGVDHVIFEISEKTTNKYNVHIIEMKTSIGSHTWNKVRKQFRASYFAVKIGEKLCV